MWVADNWRDYELIDCSRGEKLERWGNYTLVRPDPQAIWDTPRRDPRWTRADGRYSRSEAGGGFWDKRDLPASWQVERNGLTFNVKPMSFKHTGLFPEQAANWDWMESKIQKAEQRITKIEQPVSVLNLFAYTGGATVAAARAGASVCHVDAAKGMVAWAKENAASSGVADKPIRWIVDDCAKFVEREIRRGRRYDAIIMDPPSYGRGPAGEIWKLEDSLWSFVSLCAGVLSDDPLFVLINSYTTGLSPSVLTYISESVFTKKFGGRSESSELGLTATASGLILPCGASCRWVR
ncbi:MAG: class I SAM-dependent methyltransferase [Oscillospiraceae bacterium]